MMLMTVLCFFVTLACFPTLSFKVGVGISGPIRFSIITLIYNMGDLIGKWIY